MIVAVARIDGGAVELDIQDAAAVARKRDLAGIVLLDGLLSFLTFMLKDDSANLVGNKPHGVIVDLEAENPKQRFLRRLIGALILSPVGAFKHQPNGHLERQRSDAKVFVERGDALDAVQLLEPVG